MSDKWILIVNDDESIMASMMGNLNKLGQEYKVVTATNGNTALEHIKQRRFGLVVIDFQRAGMDGLQLLAQIRLARPSTRVILTADHPDSVIEAEASRLNAYHYLPKPFKMEAFLQIVKEAFETSKLNQSGMLVLSEEDYSNINRVLHQLEREVGANCVILTDWDGTSVARTGHFEKLPIERIASLLGGSIATLAEAGRAIGSNDNVINLAYSKGESDNLYAVNIGSQFLLIILIEAGPSSSKLGLVWYRAQLAVEELLEELNNAKYSTPGEMIGEDIEGAVDSEFGKLFGEDNLTEAEKKEPSSTSTPAEGAQFSRPSQTPLLSFDEALVNGIISERPGKDGFPATPEIEQP